jgi:hypothetical protein
MHTPMTNRSCFSTTQSPYQHEATTNTPYGIRSDGERCTCKHKSVPARISDKQMQTQVSTSTNQRHHKCKHNKTREGGGTCATGVSLSEKRREYLRAGANETKTVTTTKREQREQRERFVNTAMMLKVLTNIVVFNVGKTRTTIT